MTSEGGGWLLFGDVESNNNFDGSSSKVVGRVNEGVAGEVGYSSSFPPFIEKQMHPLTS